mmetsp:Transcript_46727/g.144360  ORF Transcript_46727/g.144360 Transcript_46727/m.144360 type:complete len:163 (+) Transcript_46727:1-489(+)
MEQKLKKQQAAVPEDFRNPEWLAEAEAQPGMQMSLAALTQELSERVGKPGTEEVAARWKTLLETGGVKAELQVVDPGRVLFVTHGPGFVGNIREFVLSQPETDWFEFQEQRSFPAGRDAPLMADAERERREVELGWRPKPQPARPKARARGRRRSGKREQTL